MGKIFAIAKLVKGKSVLGLRLADIDGKNVQYRDVPMESIKKVLMTGNIKIENVGIIDGEVVGTNGSIDRLTNLSLDGTVLGNAPLVVINKIGDVGYTVIDFKGIIKKARVEDVVSYAKNYGIANGKVVVRDGLEYISSINGEYETVELPPSKIGNKKEVNMNLIMNTDRRSVAKHVKEEVADEVETTDVFKSMTPEQKKVIQDYYMWLTVDIYEKMAKTTKLEISEHKAERLARLRGEDNWYFGGIKDAGYSRCELGHPIRYEYYAFAKDEQGKVVDVIIFGEQCSSDFFRISKEDMAKLVKTRMMMSDEIKIMSDIATNHTEKEEWGKIQLLVDVIKKIADRPDSKDFMYRVFGRKESNTIVNFLAVGMPFPESLVLLAKERICTYGVDRFWSEMYPEYGDTIKSILEDRSGYPIQGGAGLYLRFLTYIKLGGKYGYDPTQYVRDPESNDMKNLKIGKNDTLGRKFSGEYEDTSWSLRNKGEKSGGFAKKDAKNRQQLLYRFKYSLRCKEFTLDELESLLKFVKAYRHGLIMLQMVDKSMFNKFGGSLHKALMQEPEDDELCDIAYAIIESPSSVYFGRSYKKRVYYSSMNIKELAELFSKVYDKEFKDRIDKVVERAEEEKRQQEEEERRRREEEEWRLKEEEERRRREEEERRKREEEERRRQEELERQKREEEKAKQKEIDEEYKQDRVYKLGLLIEKHPEVEETYYIKIAKDIVNRKLKYKQLTYKQKRVIELAEVDYLKADGQELPKELVNNTYNLEDKPEIKNEVEKILSFKADKDMVARLTDVSPKIFDIAESIKRYKKVSDKQYKHIKAGIELINSLNK